MGSRGRVWKKEIKKRKYRNGTYARDQIEPVDVALFVEIPAV